MTPRRILLRTIGKPEDGGRHYLMVHPKTLELMSEDIPAGEDGSVIGGIEVRTSRYLAETEEHEGVDWIPIYEVWELPPLRPWPIAIEDTGTGTDETVYATKPKGPS